VSAAVTTPVVPPVARQRADHTVAAPAGMLRPRRTLPLPSLVTQRTTACVYGLAALDVHGRIADHAVITALGWTAGLRLDIRHAAGLIVVHADRDGDVAVTGQGHLRVPALIRHQAGLGAGDRVLLAAEPDQHRLIIVTPAALDVFLTQQCSNLSGGEPA
jgi:bifunctional DNA-binding transcriptional regulator/antitoxin component of YhaV-PrlF toxin-antitoxin module